ALPSALVVVRPGRWPPAAGAPPRRPGSRGVTAAAAAAAAAGSAVCADTEVGKAVDAANAMLVRIHARRKRRLAISPSFKVDRMLLQVLPMLLDQIAGRFTRKRL